MDEFQCDFSPTRTDSFVFLGQKLQRILRSLHMCFLCFAKAAILEVVAGAGGRLLLLRMTSDV